MMATGTLTGRAPTPQETQAAASVDIARERTRKGTLAAMKALWRELANPKIKEHHGPVVKTTRLAAIESRKGRLTSSVAPKRSGPSGPRRGHLFSTWLHPAFGDSARLHTVLRTAK